MSTGKQTEPENPQEASSGVRVFDAAAKNQSTAFQTIGRLFDVASAKVVFGEPVTAGEYTVITASEISVGMGLGFGGGGGESARPGSTPDAPQTGGSSAPQMDTGGGIGGGGGGASAARPVAAIIIGPHGVRVEPIFDVTKVAIAFITALGAMFLSRRAMRKAAKNMGA